MESLVASPSVDFKIVIEGQDVAGFQFPSQMYQAGIREIHFAVAILSKQPLERRGSLSQLEWNLKHTRPDVFQDRFGGSG
jgi:hypothetical protein